MPFSCAGAFVCAWLGQVSSVRARGSRGRTYDTLRKRRLKQVAGKALQRHHVDERRQAVRRPEPALDAVAGRQPDHELANLSRVQTQRQRARDGARGRTTVREGVSCLIEATGCEWVPRLPRRRRFLAVRPGGAQGWWRAGAACRHTDPAHSERTWARVSSCDKARAGRRRRVAETATHRFHVAALGLLGGFLLATQGLGRLGALALCHGSSLGLRTRLLLTASSPTCGDAPRACQTTTTNST